MACLGCVGRATPSQLLQRHSVIRLLMSRSMPGGRELAALLECHPTFGLHVVHHERTQETHHNLATIGPYDDLIQTKIKM